MEFGKRAPTILADWFIWVTRCHKFSSRKSSFLERISLKMGKIGKYGWLWGLKLSPTLVFCDSFPAALIIKPRLKMWNFSFHRLCKRCCYCFDQGKQCSDELPLEKCRNHWALFGTILGMMEGIEAFSISISISIFIAIFLSKLLSPEFIFHWVPCAFLPLRRLKVWGNGLDTWNASFSLWTY